jgi:multiple antibiotic resistance protein
MIETALTSFTTFFATVGPVEAAVFFATLTPNLVAQERRGIALRATLIATGILAAATLAGGPLLGKLGVTIPALQTAGGIILFLIALEMVFARPMSAFKLTPPEGAEAQTKDDLAVFPLATPLLAGPGAMSAGILLAASAEGRAVYVTIIMVALVVVMGITLALLLLAHQVTRVLGVTAQRVLMRVFGILLAAIAVQALFNGLEASGLFPSAV